MKSMIRSSNRGQTTAVAFFLLFSQLAIVIAAIVVSKQAIGAQARLPAQSKSTPKSIDSEPEAVIKEYCRLAKAGEPIGLGELTMKSTGQAVSKDCIAATDCNEYGVPTDDEAEPTWEDDYVRGDAAARYDLSQVRTTFPFFIRKNRFELAETDRIEVSDKFAKLCAKLVNSTETKLADFFFAVDKNSRWSIYRIELRLTDLSQCTE
ncbi:MAG: hypothetical protein IPJ30_03880 [Acidobacteria bacterium]|nr:hypothetical protein [Acidobacteriota bacterium]